MLTPELFTNQMAELVQFKTLPQERQEILKAMEYVKSLIDPRAHIQLLHDDTSPILLAGTHDTKTPEIVYLVHIDVVAGRDDQFKLQQYRDLLKARGAADMKFSIPLGIDQLNSQVAQPGGPSFLLAVTSDEEVGGFEGAGFLANEYGLKPKTLIVPDGGKNLHLIESSKGILVLEITGQGRPSHPCYPHLGSNPVNPVIRACNTLLEMFPSTAVDQTTVYIESITGGNSTATYAETSSCEVVITHPAHISQAELLHQVQAKLKAAVPQALEIEVAATGQPVFTDTRDQRFQLFSRLLAEERGKASPISIQPGGSDARHFHDSGALVLMTAPHGGGIHGEREHVSVKSSLILNRVLEKFMRQYQNSPADNSESQI